MIFIAWLLLAVAIGYWASNKSRSGIGWFLLAVVISPLIAGIFLLIAGESKAHTKVCPKCAETIKVEAVKCKHCGTDLPPAPAAAIPEQISNG